MPRKLETGSGLGIPRQLVLAELALAFLHTYRVAQEIEKVNMLATWSSEARPSVGDESDQRKMKLFKHSVHACIALVLHLALVGIEKSTYITAFWVYIP